MRISDWSSDVCSSDLVAHLRRTREPADEGADGHHLAGHLVARRDGVDLLLAREEAPLHRAEPAVADPHEQLVGCEVWGRLLAELDLAGGGYDGDTQHGRESCRERGCQ